MRILFFFGCESQAISFSLVVRKHWYITGHFLNKIPFSLPQVKERGIVKS